jgi:orc1/cdc6 family replication initiation protein
MIADARFLDPEFIPNDVVHRDAEINVLSSVLRPVANGTTADPAFVHGPSGTGKTCIAQYTLDKLRESVIELNTQYVNCWEYHSHFDTLYRVLEGVGQTLDIHRQSTPQTLLLERLHDYDGPPYVVILDEVDQLDDSGVLYELHRTPNLSMILIGNQEEQFFSRLDGRVASRLHTSTRIKFDLYGNDELVAILEGRVHRGFHPDTVSEAQLRKIADAAAGDARVAIGILRTAARQAEQDSAETIAEQYIVEAIPEAKAEITQKNIEKLTDDQRILYEIIKETGDIAPGNLYKRYKEQADDVKTKRMVRNYLTKLTHYNLIESSGSDRGRRYCHTTS